jgi:hypothetical protein
MTHHAFIVSTGRTGTQFLAHYFEQNFAHVTARHEPKPSYLLCMASNAYAADKPLFTPVTLCSNATYMSHLQ